MGLSNSELESMADDIYRNRRITGSIYCGTCGYNLKTLPYVYRCPECGHHYNARPFAMKGIFFPQVTTPPVADPLAAVFFAAIAFPILCAAFTPFNGSMLFIGLTFAGLTAYFAGRAYVHFRAYQDYRSISKRIIEEEGE
ncbi:MAG: hypothetical protein JSU63_10855 [Phycisphaerales bacterium]|nr:MAG: hypothetical protein JSU63_10855 [Phycisphaerales bacterium]